MGPVYKGQGPHLGGRAMQSSVVGDDVVVVGDGGGRRGGCRTIKTPNYKRRGWNRSSEMWMLFEDKQARLGHPLYVETSNKQGACMLKIRCRICCTLISYHNSSWTCMATHILYHNMGTPQAIVVADPLASECGANGEPFPIHKLPTPPRVKKEPTS